MSGFVGLFKSLSGLVMVSLMTTAVFADDYVFSEVSSYEFPTSYDILMHQVYDLDHDGYDELLVLFPKSYYVYSLLFDTVLFSDTSAGTWGFSGLLAMYYDDDALTDILLLTARSRLYLQDGSFESDRQLLDTISELSWMPSPVQAAHMFVGDADMDGQDELIIGRWGYDFLGDQCMSQPAYDEWFRGEVWAGTADGFDRVWFSTGLNGEHVSYIDMAGDGQVQLAAWGTWEWLDWVWDYQWGYCDMVIHSGQQFAIADASGAILLEGTSYGLHSLAGQIDTTTAGDDVVVFKDGDSFEPDLFTPSGQFGLYCLGMTADTVGLLWARDANGFEGHMFQIKSVPGTFCISTASDQYSLCSGMDGSVIGAVHGLTRGKTTDEGHFLPPSFERDIQLAQLSGRTVHLYQLLGPTGVPWPPQGNLPSAFRLVCNYPNPFNAGTTIEFALDRRATVTLEVFDLLGRRLVTLLDRSSLANGIHQVYWDGQDEDSRTVSSGVYFTRLSTPTGQTTHKMLLLK